MERETFIVVRANAGLDYADKAFELQVQKRIKEGYIPCGSHVISSHSGEYSVSMMLPEVLKPISANTIEMVEEAKNKRNRENWQEMIRRWAAECEQNYGPGRVEHYQDGSCKWFDNKNIGTEFEHQALSALGPPQYR